MSIRRELNDVSTVLRSEDFYSLQIINCEKYCNINNVVNNMSKKMSKFSRKKYQKQFSYYCPWFKKKTKIISIYLLIRGYLFHTNVVLFMWIVLKTRTKYYWSNPQSTNEKSITNHYARKHMSQTADFTFRQGISFCV